MADETDRAHLRLAELVAALSLGVDLGFGQPMEHVLRQCLIALRLAELPAGDDGLDAYRALLESLRGTMRDGARIILEVDPRRTEAVRSLITAEFAGVETVVARDLAGRDRVVDAQLPA